MKTKSVRIEDPCSASWDEMHGDDQKRFCDHCTKHVHHLSAMTRQGARSLLRERADEGLCVRYAYDATGRVRFSRRRVQPSAPLPQRVGAAALLATASMAASLLSACDWPVEAHGMAVETKGDGDDHAPVLMGEPMPIEPEWMGEAIVDPGELDGSGEGSGEPAEEPCDPDAAVPPQDPDGPPMPRMGLFAPDVEFDPPEEPLLEEMGDVIDPEAFFDEADTHGDVEIQEVTPAIDPDDEVYMVAGGLRPMPREYVDPTATLDAQEDRAADQLAAFGISLDDEEIVDEEAEAELEASERPRQRPVQGRIPLRTPTLR